ncbi:CaiB/BaiF CoA transferase family protein, partial [Caballeronia sp.]|uniref:CaiB/BaiF CoA transferase family protein n=1 Tax=Caballeronia sp. TaxID=1931223 RepID=UPI003C363EA0
GQDGPYANWPGFDSIAQGMGGLMSVTGKPGEGPMRVGIPIADLCAGHFCAMAILTALLEREASGEGQWVQTSLLEAQLAMLDFQAAQWLVDGKVPEQVGNEHPLTVPTGVFATQDGYLNLAAIGQTMWMRLCDALGLEDLARAPGYDSDPARVGNRDAVNKVVSEVFKTRTTTQWTEILLKAGVPCGPIYGIDEVFDDPQVRHLGITWPVDLPGKTGAALVGQPFRLSRYPREAAPRLAPEHGEHTQAILQELGYSGKQIEQWRKTFVV